MFLKYAHTLASELYPINVALLRISVFNILWVAWGALVSDSIDRMERGISEVHRFSRR